MNVGPIHIDTAARHVTVNGAPAKLTRKEYDLLVFLATDPTRVFTHDEIMEAVWGYVPRTFVTDTLRTHASRLRVELGRAGVVNRWGVGYSLLPVEVAAA